MNNCILLGLIMGGMFLGIPACFGLGYLFKKMTVKTYKRLKDVEFPKVNIVLYQIGVNMRKWYYKHLDYTSQVQDFLNKLAKEGIQPDGIKISSSNDGHLYFWDEEIKYE